HGRLAPWRQHLLDLEQLAAVADQRPDDGHGAVGQGDNPQQEAEAKARERATMTESREPIGVIGVGWVGLGTAACFADLGYRGVARDILPEKVASLSRGETTIHEPQLDDLLARNAERLAFTTDMDELLAAARLLFVCVDTPPTRSGDADLSRVRAVV